LLKGRRRAPRILSLPRAERRASATISRRASYGVAFVLGSEPLTTCAASLLTT
jgi:hypothetical protein